MQKLPATTTIHHKAIAGATRVDELDELTRLCPICSVMISSIMQFVEAEDIEAAKRRLLATLAVAK